jgi:mannitol-1-phosphate 5-dehydrogenase
LDEYVGLIETSIGKMVPIMPEKELERDPLMVYAEPYNTLIVDRK